MDENRDLPVENTPTDETSTSRDWVAKLRYSRSFTAKLVVSDLAVKEYYASVATALLSYERVRARVGWSGITFTRGRVCVAKVAFSGKTLCLYLAVDPEAYSHGKYRFTDVRSVGKYASCPAKIKIKSKRALAFVLRAIGRMAEEKGYALRVPALPPVSPKDFPSDTFGNLLARGLIRTLGTGVRTVEKRVLVPVTEEEEKGDKPVEPAEELRGESYLDTLRSNASLVGRHGEYDVILDFLRRETAEVTLVQRYVVKTIDEKWVAAIEDSLDALDECVRKPSHFIQETEELLPIERTKKVTPRSIRHLCEHTDLIAEATDDEIIPTHLLNVFRDDSLLTYENKFVNTLLRRLYAFVNERYQQAEEFGANERVSVLSFSDAFNDGPIRGKIAFTMEISEPSGGNVKQSVKTRALWRRVVKLKGVVGDYFKSELVQKLGNTFIVPPVVRTNAILKNPNLRRCLTLWEFIESYEDEGNGITMEEKDVPLDKAHLDLLYNGLAQQYFALRYNTTDSAALVGGRQWKADIAASKTDRPVFDENLGTEGVVMSDEETLWALEAAIAADRYLDELPESERKQREKERWELLRSKQQEEEEREWTIPSDAYLPEVAATEERPEEEPEETDSSEREEEDRDEAEEEREERTPDAGTNALRYKKSFEAKLRLSEERVKAYYCGIHNAFLSKERVRARGSYNAVTFFCGRRILARATVVGKTLRVYYALDPGALPHKYGVRDASDVKRFALTPAMLRVKSDRGYRYALELVDAVCAGLDESTATFEKAKVSDYKTESLERLVEMGLVQKYSSGIPEFEIPKKRDTEPKQDIPGAGGDALIPTAAAEIVGEIVLPGESVSAPEEKPEDLSERKEQKQEGDALRQKPITLEEILATENGGRKEAQAMPAEEPTEAEEEEPEQGKRGFWSRLIRKKK